MCSLKWKTARSIGLIGLALFAAAGALFAPAGADSARAADANRIADPNAYMVVAEPDLHSWQLIISPYLWAASLSGHLNAAGRRADIAVPFADIVDHLDFSVMGNVELTNQRFGMYFDGQYTKTSQYGTVHQLALAADITSTIIAAGAFFRAVELPLDGMTVFGRQRIFALEPMIGLRWTQLKLDFQLPQYADSARLRWTDPLIGARLYADLTPRWNLFLQADIGGFNSGTDLSAQAQGYLGYRTHLFSQPALLRFGYRALYQDYLSGDIAAGALKWNVTQHGPVAGISIVF